MAEENVQKESDELDFCFTRAEARQLWVVLDSLDGLKSVETLKKLSDDPNNDPDKTSLIPLLRRLEVTFNHG